MTQTKVLSSLLIAEARFLDPDPTMLLASEPTGGSKSNPRFHQLNQAIAQLVREFTVRPFIGGSATPPFVQIEDHPLVQFLPLNLTSTNSLETIISHIDFTMQYGEDEEPREVREWRGVRFT